jgi:O-antigen/teichoic acid export membrane protein
MSNRKKSSLSLKKSLTSGILLNLLVNLLLYFGHLIIARRLPRTEYATFTIIVSFVSLSALFADLGLTFLFVRKFAEAEASFAMGKKDERGELLGSMLALRFGMAIIVSIAVLIITPLIGYSGEIRHLVMIMLATLFISSRLLVVRSVGEAFLRGHNKYHYVVLFTAVDALVFAGVLYFYNNSIGLEEAVWIYSLCHLPGFILLSLLIYRNALSIGFRLHFRLKIIGSLLREGMPLILSTAFLTIHSQIDPLLIEKLNSLREVSAFGASLRVFSAIIYLPGIFAAVIGPLVSNATLRGEYKAMHTVIDKSLRTLLVCALFIAIVLSVSSGEIVNILFGSNKYYDAVLLVKILGWSLIPIWFGGFITEIAIAEGKMWLLSWYTLILMLVSISGDFLLIPSFGAKGAVISKLVAVSCGSIMLFIKSDNLHVFDRKKILNLLLKLSGVTLCYLLIKELLAFSSINYITQSGIIIVSCLTITIFIFKIISLSEIHVFVSDFFNKIKVEGG